MNPPLQRSSVADQIRRGLEESIRHATGETPLPSTVVKFPDQPPAMDARQLAELRLGHQLSFAAFARLLNVTPKTVQHWEQGLRKPSPVALRLLQILRENPDLLRSFMGMTQPAPEPFEPGSSPVI